MGNDGNDDLTFREAERIISSLRRQLIDDPPAPRHDLFELQLRMNDIEANFAMLLADRPPDEEQANLIFAFGPAGEQRVSFNLREIQALQRVARAQLESETKRREQG